jgi:signal transduction histidine kinase
MSQNAYMQAIYETGARLTHDIKNIVQSMGTLCIAAEQTPDRDSARLLVLLRRQLPLLNQRLTRTLAKLEEPGRENTRDMLAAEWWQTLQERYVEKVIFSAPENPLEVSVDAELLDSVVENLLQNALTKCRTDPHMEIFIKTGMTDHYLWVEVRDTGKAMPAEKAEQLFKKQVSSEHGLGIGLFHAGKQAEQAGYALSLIENRDGSVRFRLERA